MKKKAYLIGIKGVGMTSLAVYLKESGYQILGSDIEDFFPTDNILQDYNIHVIKGFSKENINEKYDMVIVTGAHGGLTNPEVVKAKKLNIPVYTQGEFLGKILSKKKGISIAGCHGKTTTSSLVAFIFTKAGLDPSYIIGTPEINGLGPAGHFGAGEYFIAEADEYLSCPFKCRKSKFLWQKPKIIIITNIDYDHPDAFSSLDDIKKVFIEFINNLPDDGLLVACIDDPNLAQILPFLDKQVISYGFSSRADYQIDKYYFGEGINFFQVSYQKKVNLGSFAIKIAGKHNMLNALASSIVANYIGIDWYKIKKYLSQFTGSKRRFEKISQINKILLYDDYAHHPKEIESTITGFRQWFPHKKIFIIFQPHTYSRTKALLKQFSNAFIQADLVLIPDIFASAREKDDCSITSEKLVKEINARKKNALYLKNKEMMLNLLRKKLTGDDLIVTMGAGDIYLWHKDIIKIMQQID